jgi:hypothetical protein
MVAASSLDALTEAVANAVPAVDHKTTGQYGDGLGSEDEERQLELLLDHLREAEDATRRLTGRERIPMVVANAISCCRMGCPWRHYLSGTLRWTSPRKLSATIEHWFEIDAGVCRIYHPMSLSASMASLSV